MKKEKAPWSRDQKIGAIAAALVVLGIVVGLFVPEVRRWVGLEPAPAPVTRPTNNSEIASAPTPTTGPAKAKIDKPQPKKRSRKIATPQTASKPSNGVGSPTPGPTTSGATIYNNFLAGPRPIITGKAKDTMITDNDYYQASPDLSDGQRTLFEGNRITRPPSSNFKIGGEDTVFADNTVAGDNNLEVSETAKRTFIHHNLFQSQALINSISNDQRNIGERESWLRQVRSAFEKSWGTLSPSQYQTNEELLKQFEQSVRDTPYDANASRILLEKMIAATTKESAP